MSAMHCNARIGNHNNFVEIFDCEKTVHNDYGYSASESFQDFTEQAFYVAL